MGREQELVSLSSFGNDLLASGRFSSLDSPDFFTHNKLNQRKDITVAPEKAKKQPFGLFSSGWSTLSAASAITGPESPGSLIVGGANVRNVSLVIGDHDDKYSDLSVLPVPVSGTQKGGGSLLVAPVAEKAARPMLFLSADNDSEISFPKDSASVSLPELGKELDASKGKIGAAAVDNYVLTGDLENFFGIKGLVGKLYSFKGDEKKDREDEKKKDKKEEDDKTSAEKPDEPASKSADEEPKDEEDDGEKKDEKDSPVQEKVKLGDMKSPLAILFPDIEHNTIQKLPIKNLEFTYSNKEEESLFPVGLRLNGDLELKDGLQFMTDGLKKMVDSDKSASLPTKLRISAHLGKKRDWSKRPKIEGMVLQAALDDMTLPAWDFLEFKTVGVELSVRREGGKKDDDKKEEYENDEEEEEESVEENDTEQDHKAIGPKIADTGQEVAPKDDSKPGDKEAPDESEDAGMEKVKEEDSADDSKSKKEKRKWKVGFGLFGKLNITKLPKSTVPLEARYWVRMGSWKEDKEEDDGKNQKNKAEDDKEEGGEDGKGEETVDAISDEEDKEDKEDEEGKEKTERTEEEEEVGKKYELVIQTGEWKDFCGISNLSMARAELRAFFKPGEFKNSCTLAVSGALEFPQGSLEKNDGKEEKQTDSSKPKKLGESVDGDTVAKAETDDKADADKEDPKNASLEIKGQLSRKDYFFDAKVGDLKLDSILKIYAQISGAQPSKEEVKEHSLTFKELHLRIGRKLKKNEAVEDEKNDKENNKENAEEKVKGKIEEGVDEKDGEVTASTEEKAMEKGEKKGEETEKEDDEEAEWAFELSGKVSFNDVKSVKGLVKIDGSGLTIEGGLEDYKIKDTDINIKEANIDIFIGAKPDPAKEKEQKKISSSPKEASGASNQQAVAKATGIENSEKKDVAKRDAEKIKVTAFNRASKFAIKGKVEFNGLTVTVAFMTERKETNRKSKKTSDREWILYGVLDGDLRLSGLCSDLKGSKIGNIQLRNIALIAASGESKTVEDLNSLKYPVKRGLSLCATIPPLPELNSLAKQNVDGLVLVANIQKKLDLRIRLPKSFDVEFSKTVKLNDIGIGIEISKNPSLMLEGVLTILMESGQDPLELEGMIRAGVLSASAQVATKSPWVNPFNISKEVKIADFRVEFEITYATLLEAGPSKIGLLGEVEVGELQAGAGMSLSHYPDQQLLKANISKVDLIEIIHAAGRIANIQALMDLGGAEDTFVFTDASMYFSTGATISDKEYPRGISAGGKLTAFGKSAEFDFSIGAAGLDFKGYIDNFSLGPLVVSSASGDPRASMIVLMTKDQQTIKVDGMVTCFGIGLVTLVDIQMGTKTPSFDAYIAVQFTQAFEISLRATVEDFKDVKDLATKGLQFHAQIRGDLFDMICESIKRMLKAIEELGTQGIEAMQNLIGAKIAEKQREMDKRAKDLEAARQKVEARRSDRQKVMKQEELKREKASDEINRLRNNVAEAKRDRDLVEKELKEKVERAKMDKEAMIQRKREEYNDKLAEAKEDERRNREKLADLKRRQENKYGTNFLKKVDIAKGAYYEKCAAEEKSWADVKWVSRQKDAAGFWTRGYWAIRLEAAKADHEIVKLAVGAYLESAKLLETTARSDAFQFFVTGIEEAQKGIERAVNGIDSLVSGGGFDGFVRAFVDTEESRIEAAIKDLHAMQSDNSRYQEAIRKAQAILNKNGPELEKEIAEADEAIARIKEDAELGQLTREYEYQLKAHDEVHNTIEQMQAGLETLKENWKAGMEKLEGVVDEVQKFISSVFHVDRIEVGVHTHALVNDKPLMFKFIGTVGGNKFEVEAEWAPGKALKDLYKDVTSEVLKIA